MLGALLLVTLNAAPAAGEPMRFDVRNTGYEAGEPTLGVLRDGSIVYQAMTKTIKTSDEGNSWKLLHEPPTGTITLDPYVHVDEASNRILASQLFGACQLISISDDGGDTWLDDPSQCGSGDHQKLGSGPWPASGGIPAAPFRFPSAVYTCVNHVVDTACAVSADGGLTWGPLVTAFAGIDPTTNAGVNGIPGLCGGLEGDPAVGPDGTLYLPREYCGRPFLGVSRNNGATWTLHRVGGSDSKTLPIAFGANNPSVAVGADGDVYYAWTDGAYQHRVARSGDRGATWSTPTVIHGGFSSTTFPFVVAGADGRVATGFIGATGGEPGNPGSVGNDAEWHLYLASSMDADAASPQYELGRVTPAGDPIMLGCVGRHGGSCSGHDQLLDFNDVAVLPDGRLAIAYVDACLPPDCAGPATSKSKRGHLAVQVGGPVIR